jgi:glycosyltransferase 2 family protein
VAPVVSVTLAHENQLMSNNTVETTEKKNPARSSRVSVFVKLGLTAVALYFVGNQIQENWSEVTEFEWALDPFRIGVSLILHLVTFALFSQVWRWLIGAYGHKVSLGQSFRIAYLANLGRYVPGKIWTALGMVYLAKQEGISERESLSSWIVAQFYAITSSFALCALIALARPSILADVTQIVSQSVISAALIVVVVLTIALLSTPMLVERFVNFGLSVLRRAPISLTISRSLSMRLFFGYLICWASYGYAFWWFTTGISASADIPVLVGIGAFVIAYQVGYLALFAPGGIGVRELALTVVLSPFIGDAAVAVAVAARLWNTSAEILATIIAFKIKSSK